MRSLAVKYRPTSFDDVTEQGSVRLILENQIKTNTIKNGYLFAGGAGTGKTTCARIFANMINNGHGVPIELDAASNNSVDGIRRLTEDAQTQSIDSEYKVFILDEVHSLSNQAWQAMLKTLEEPPAKSVFIMCTTNPEKIPATILSRVQRYNFQRISLQGIVDRLRHICEKEFIAETETGEQSIEYIAKLAEGGMRDAITLMDKCLSYNENLTVDNVVKALGLADYDTMRDLFCAINDKDEKEILHIVNEVHYSGVDLKLFTKTFFEFILDLTIYQVTKSIGDTKIPNSYTNFLKKLSNNDYNNARKLLSTLLDVMSVIKWEQNPKMFIIARLILFTEEL